MITAMLGTDNDGRTTTICPYCKQLITWQATAKKELVDEVFACLLVGNERSHQLVDRESTYSRRFRLVYSPLDLVAQRYR